jgi:hypothetical protein
MPHLLARANEVLLEAQWLRREGRALRLEAAMLASELGETILRATGPAENRGAVHGPDQQIAATPFEDRQR